MPVSVQKSARRQAVDVCVLAIDIGGTKMAAGVVTADGVIEARVTTATPPRADAEQLWSTLTTLIDELRAGDVTAVGVGCGGPRGAGAETVSPLNLLGWREFPLRRRLAKHTGLEVRGDNDGKALALGEGWLGAAKRHDHFMAMVVSSG